MKSGKDHRIIRPLKFGAIYSSYLSTELSFQMDPSKPVMVAGDLERMHEKISKQDGGITYHCSIINAMVMTALVILCICCNGNHGDCHRTR